MVLNVSKWDIKKYNIMLEIDSTHVCWFSGIGMLKMIGISVIDFNRKEICTYHKIIVFNITVFHHMGYILKEYNIIKWYSISFFY